MASLQTIAKAQAFGLALKKMTGEEPSYQYYDDYVRIYYQPDRLKKVQEKVQEISSKEPGDVRFDWFQVVTPLAIKKGLPIAGAIFFLGYLLGGKR